MMTKMKRDMEEKFQTQSKQHHDQPRQNPGTALPCSEPRRALNPIFTDETILTMPQARQFL